MEYLEADLGWPPSIPVGSRPPARNAKGAASPASAALRSSLCCTPLQLLLNTAKLWLVPETQAQRLPFSAALTEALTRGKVFAVWASTEGKCSSSRDHRHRDDELCGRVTRGEARSLAPSEQIHPTPRDGAKFWAPIPSSELHWAPRALGCLSPRAAERHASELDTLQQQSRAPLRLAARPGRLAEWPQLPGLRPLGARCTRSSS